MTVNKKIKAKRSKTRAKRLKTRAKRHKLLDLSFIL